MPVSEKAAEKPKVINQKPYNVFYVWYTELCRRINMSPLPFVKPAKLKNQHILDFSVDRIKLDEWNPIIRALRQDTSIHVLAIRSRVIKAGKKFLPEVDSREKIRELKMRSSLILTAFILNPLVRSVSTCVQTSSVLSNLELDGLPISGTPFESINASLILNRSIRVLSFIHCPIGDQGCEILAKNLRTLPNIEIINLTSCELGPLSAQNLAKVIKFQQINRYCESWHCSLRYKDPDVKKMTGLKRITLNNNPKIGDEGLSYILNELDDDLWIKALDMQRCSITEKIADRLIDVVEYSKSLEVADFRHNDLAQTSLEKILDLLNSKENDHREFYWCYTTSTLPCSSSVYDTTSMASSNVQKSKSAPLRRPPTVKSSEGDNQIPLRRAKTFSLFPKQSATRVSAETRYPQVDELGQAKKEIINLGNKLKIEMTRRRQIEQENLHLKQQLLEVNKGKSKVKMHTPCPNNKLNEKSMRAPLKPQSKPSVQKSQVKFVFPPKQENDKTKVQQIFMNLLQKPIKTSDDKVNNYLKMYKEYKNNREETPRNELDHKIDKSNKSLQRLINGMRSGEEGYDEEGLLLSFDSSEDSTGEDPTNSMERDDKFDKPGLLSYIRQYNYNDNQHY